eukprot:301981_1
MDTSSGTIIFGVNNGSAIFPAQEIGTSVTITMTFDFDCPVDVYCPGCIRQIMLGYDGTQMDCFTTGSGTKTYGNTLQFNYVSDGFSKTIMTGEELNLGCAEVSGDPVNNPIGYVAKGFTYSPTFQPTSNPTSMPTFTESPTMEPTFTYAPSKPTIEPTMNPTIIPTEQPSNQPTDPTFQPTLFPTSENRHSVYLYDTANVITKSLLIKQGSRQLLFYENTIGPILMRYQYSELKQNVYISMRTFIRNDTESLLCISNYPKPWPLT